MKNKKSIIHLIELACACLILLGPGLIFAGEKSGGHVMVNRVANFGTDLSLSVSVDGSEVANLVEGQITMAICLPASTSSPRWFLQILRTRIRGTRPSM